MGWVIPSRTLLCPPSRVLEPAVPCGSPATEAASSPSAVFFTSAETLPIGCPQVLSPPKPALSSGTSSKSMFSRVPGGIFQKQCASPPEHNSLWWPTALLPLQLAGRATSPSQGRLAVTVPTVDRSRWQLEAARKSLVCAPKGQKHLGLPSPLSSGQEQSHVLAEAAAAL